MVGLYSELSFLPYFPVFFLWSVIPTSHCFFFQWFLSQHWNTNTYSAGGVGTFVVRTYMLCSYQRFKDSLFCNSPIMSQGCRQGGEGRGRGAEAPPSFWFILCNKIGVVYWTVLCYHPYPVSMLFAIPTFFILVEIVLPCGLQCPLVATNLICFLPIIEIVSRCHVSSHKETCNFSDLPA